MPALSFGARAQRYARQVVAGDIVACKWVKAACQRHLDDLECAATYQGDGDWPYYFDEEEAQRVCQFVESMPHVKGEGAKRVRVEQGLVYPSLVLEDFQVFFVAVPFGWRHRETQRRRFRRIYLELARKNAKSTVLAAIALYMLCADGEEGPEIYAAATKKDQAKIIWEEVACEMIRRQPEFGGLGVGFNKSRIYCTHNAGKFTPLARDYGSLDGLNPSCFISDELHAQKDRGLYDVLDSATGARAQPMGIGITTAGTDRAGICYAQRTYVTKILNAVLLRHGGMGYKLQGNSIEDDAYFGIIFTLDTAYADNRPDDDWADPNVWIKANPMLAAQSNEEYAKTLLADLVAHCTKAVAMVSEQPEFRTKRCNQWLGSDEAWMDMHAWAKCADPELREEDFAGDECVLGLDAAFKTDVFANMKVFERDGVVYVFGRYYVPEAMAAIKGNDHIRAWVEEGLVRQTPGPVVDVEAVKDDLRDDQRKHVVREVAFDPAQLTQFAGEMLDEGFELVEVRPTVLNFSEPMKRLLELVLQGRLRHNGDRVLEWMVSNVVCHRDHKDNIYPNKEKPENKIDGVIGLLMCLSRMQIADYGSAPTEVMVV